MNALRWTLLALCLATPAISYHLGGASLWVAHGAGCLVAAGIALWLLHDDGQLRGAFEYKPGDPALSLIVASALYLGLLGIFSAWIAPDPILRVCGRAGAWIPRPDVHGLGVAAEWIRDRACAAFARSAGVRGPQRGALVVLLAAAEEVAWRGGVQQVLAQRLGSTRGWVAASVLFGLAHLGTGNVTVALLALAGGFAWGGLFLLRGRLLPAVLSHVAFSFFFFYYQPLFAIRFDGLGG